MARSEQDREDILREAKALVNRAEYQSPLWPEPLVIGVRANDALSLFLGQDPAYHWNSQGELRRAYSQGLLYKAQAGQLISLRRDRSATAVELVSQPLTTAAQEQFLTQVQQHVALALEVLRDPATQCVGEVLTSDMSRPFSAHAINWLTAVQKQLRVAQVPNVS
jgi:hypothetical protein